MPEEKSNSNTNNLDMLLGFILQPNLPSES
jgi:hypothetical protein